MNIALKNEDTLNHLQIYFHQSAKTRSQKLSENY